MPTGGVFPAGSSVGSGRLRAAVGGIRASFQKEFANRMSSTDYVRGGARGIVSFRLLVFGSRGLTQAPARSGVRLLVTRGLRT